MLFSDLKVIDAASFLAGPCAATILADYGADVIKVEPPGGDRHRSIAANHPSEHSWQLTDRNRRDICLDITAPEGHAVLMQMLRSADVFVVNFSAAQMKKHNLEWETLRAVNPRLVYAEISAYGLKGADAEKRAFDLTGFFARTGILDWMHEKDEPPVVAPGGVGDHATAMTLFAGIMMALYKRDRTGEGSFVHTSLAATGAWANGLALQSVIAGVDNAARRDEEGWSNPMQNIYTTGDGRHMFIAVQNIRRDWPKLIDVLERPEWHEDETMQAVKPLFRNRFQAKARIADAVACLSAAELGTRLEAAGIVHGLVHRNAEVLDDAQLIDNGVIVPFDSGLPGADRTLATPINLSGETQRVPQRAPKIGEHSREVLAEFGYDAPAIDALLASGVVRQPE
jgi:formyl-CoA transferase